MAESTEDPGREEAGDGPKERRSTGELLKVWGPLLAVAAIGFAVAVAYLEPPAPDRFQIAAGAPGGAYHRFAEEYRDRLREEGYELEIVDTAGSVENLRRLRSGDVPLAILQGGATLEAGGDGEDAGGSGEDSELHSLASLFFEPVWVFHRADVEVELIRDLSGLRIGVGAPGSGTRALALQLLAENGVDGGSGELRELASADAVAALEAGELDAAFFVASPKAPYVRRLLAADGIELLPIRRYRAYRQNHPYLSRVTLGEGVVDLARNLPAEDVPMVAAAASLVISDELHHALVPLLLEAAVKVHRRGGAFEPPGTFPSTEYVDLPLLPQARQYLERGPSFLYGLLPYRTAATIDRLKILLLPFITLLIPVFKMAPPIYRWQIRSKIYRWYENLREIDEAMHRNPDDDRIDELTRSLRQLEEEVVAEVSVPLSYMDEFYRLREHIDLILVKLERLEAERGQSSGGAAAR